MTADNKKDAPQEYLINKVLIDDVLWRFGDLHRSQKTIDLGTYGEIDIRTVLAAIKLGLNRGSIIWSWDPKEAVAEKPMVKFIPGAVDKHVLVISGTGWYDRMMRPKGIEGAILAKDELKNTICDIYCKYRES